MISWAPTADAERMRNVSLASNCLSWPGFRPSSIPPRSPALSFGHLGLVSVRSLSCRERLNEGGLYTSLEPIQGPVFEP